MRRQAQFLISLALLAVSFSAAANAGAAARTELAPGACPGNGPVCCQPVAGTPKVVPCCEPTILPCPGSLTIVAAPDPSKPRHAVKITGRLVTFGAAITLWQELPGKTAFRQLAQTTTDGTGHYSFTRPAGSVQTDRSWYTSSASARSATVSQRVWDAITLAVRATKGGTGEMVTFTGKVFPSHAGQRMRLERRAGKAWVLIARVRLTARSSFRLAEQFAGASSAFVRAVMAGDGRNIKSYSAAVKTTL